MPERLIRLDDHHAVRSVQHDRLAAGKRVQGIATADHGRDLHAARHDRDVRGGTPGRGDESENVVTVHLRGFRGREVIGNDDDRGRDRSDIRQLDTGDAVQQAPADITQIGGAFAHVVVVQRVHVGGVVLHHHGHRFLRAHQVVFDPVPHLGLDRVVVQQFDVALEDLRLRGAQGYQRLGVDRVDLRFRPSASVQKSLHLRGGVAHRDRGIRYRNRFVPKEAGRSGHDSRRCGNTAYPRHRA